MTGPQGPAAPDERDAFAELFDAHAQHLFDYCYTLLGERARAASATQVTLIAAHSLADRLQDPDRMRAWVLALGRWECLSGAQRQARRSHTAEPDEPDDLAAALAFVDGTADGPVTETGELTLSDFETVTGRPRRAMLLALPRDDREILDLAYRHDVSDADVAAIIGLPASSVPAMLATARAKFGKEMKAAMSRAGADWPGQVAAADELAALPLARLPSSVWRRTARVIIDPRFRSYREAVSSHAEHLGPDGFPVQAEAGPTGRKLLMASALMAGLLLAPATAGGVVYAAFATATHASSHQPSGSVTPSAAQPGTSATGGNSSTTAGGHSSAKSKQPGSVAGGDPAGGSSVGRPSPSHRPKKPTASPQPTSRLSSPASPWPSGSPTTGSPSPTTSPTSPTPTPTTSPSSSAASPSD